MTTVNNVQKSKPPQNKSCTKTARDKNVFIVRGRYTDLEEGDFVVDRLDLRLEGEHLGFVLERIVIGRVLEGVPLRKHFHLVLVQHRVHDLVIGLNK